MDPAILRSKIRLRSTFGARIRSSLLTLSAFAVGAASSLYATPGYAELQTGASIENATVRDANDKEATIPHLGTKVLLILYTDPDVADQNDRFKLFLLTDGETDHDDGFWAVLLGLQSVRYITNHVCHH